MAYRFAPRSVHQTNQSRLEAIDFEPLLDSIEVAALLGIHSYCNCGANSPACAEGVVISTSLSNDGREIPCLCIL